ncbi:hypothetical protein [Actinokineospora bangkokensis]|uniref:Glycerophosphoryl diester phosphodiesterase membrane domain-containing protein n=1 Tax=Actinokineospora bangkokensis TaxID=1193682 RepID=A0A1Q9LI72_9PSEU|nr:hypothetical protein [Actinokineospora bangkokensis]OLR91726.1 hypothetical protein BJP25_25305 [Actinokineospora bangkokensis]
MSDEPRFEQQGRSTGGGEPLRLGVVPLRPLGLGDLLSGAVQAVHRNAGPLLGFALLLMLCVELLRWVVSTLVLGGLPDSAGVVSATGVLNRSLLSDVAVDTLIQSTLSGLLGLVFTGVLTVVVIRSVFGHSPGLRQAFAESAPALPRMFVAWLVQALLVGAILAAALLLVAVLGPLAVLVLLGAIVAVLYLTTAFSFSLFAVVMEDSPALASLGRSRQLVHAVGWWRVFGISMLVGLVSLLLVSVVQAVFSVVSGGSMVTEILAAAVVSAAQLAYGGAVSCLLYFDHRARTEGIEGLWQKAG